VRKLLILLIFLIAFSGYGQRMGGRYGGRIGGREGRQDLQLFIFKVIDTQIISGYFSVASGEKIIVDWGDGTYSTYKGIGDLSYSKDYGSKGNRTVTIYRALFLTKFTMTESGANIAFDLDDLPANLTSFNCTGLNTVSGDLANLPSGLTLFTCAGSNTISDDLGNLPSGLVYFYCTGSNTINGDLGNLPSGLVFFRCEGHSTISDYSGKTWTTKPATFITTPILGGMSSTEVDNLLIDFDDDLTWAEGDVITITGTHAARTSASDAAVANMETEGATVTTN